MKDILKAVEYLHNKNIVHKNINSNVVFLCQDNNGKIIAKLGGFDVESTLIKLCDSLFNELIDSNIKYFSPEFIK